MVESPVDARDGREGLLVEATPDVHAGELLKVAWGDAAMHYYVPV
jgi:hypothetical protein